MLYQTSAQTYTGVASGTTLEVFCDPNATTHQIKINKSTATAGTVTPTAYSRGAMSAESMKDDAGAAIVYNAATSTAQTYRFNGFCLDKIVFTPSGLNGTYNVHYTAW